MQACVFEAYRSRGPGGQHRNKVSSAVRLRLRGSELSAIAEEERSQHANRRTALSRLREAIALTARLPPPAAPVEWPSTVHVSKGRLHVNESNAGYFAVVALVLDALDFYEGDLKGAAAHLELTTSSLTRLITSHAKLWAQASRIRERFGLPRIRA